MASTEQPPKKRKLYDLLQPSSPQPPSTAEPQPPAPHTSANVPTTTLSQEEIARKRRNQEEIANFYESYKRLKYCISQKDARLMPELEQAYLSLITASRGCTSVQRLVAEFVPKYASCCPTALEAAAKVCINVHNWSMAIINRGEDADGFSFGTAKISIFGLATICQAASSETPTSSVIQGICSAVFLNVLTFFISSFEGQGIFQIVNKDVANIFDSPKTFSDLKEKVSNENESPSVILSKFRALCMLWIFFTCPRNSLAACFELCTSNSISTDAVPVPNGGLYFLNQSKALANQLHLTLCLTSPLLFEKILEEVKSGDKQVDSDGDDTNSSKNTPRQFLVPRTSEASVREGSITSNTSSNNSGGPKSMDLDSVDHKEFPHASSSTPRDPFDGRNQTGNNRTFESPNKHHVTPLTGQPSWLGDGDRAAMDVYTASRQLWVGSLGGPDSSEGHFLDIGVGTRGDINGVAVGCSCHVYVGNIQSQLEKDEILYEVRKVVFKGPVAVNELMSEGALLMEFGSPEEVATVIGHLRHYRKDKTQRDSVTFQSNNMQYQNWTYRNNPESVSLSHMQGHYGPPPSHSQPIQMRPMYYPPPPTNSSWGDPQPHGMIHHHHVAAPPPFLPPPPASVTPLTHNALPPPHHDQMYYVPPQPDVGPPPLPPQLTLPPPLPLPPQPNMPPLLPIHPELPPPLPPSPPPSFESQPPPPPPPAVESPMMGSHWQGTLSKSGVHYSTIHARKLHSDVCNYSDNNISEPTEWPAKLDITKRTDFRHVMSTFSSTPPHKREVCQLLPSSAADHKGFQDFISYLKQRECAGVIKIGTTRTIWSRLVFILPYSHETCSLLSIAPDTPDCLIALVLPKETNFEWV
ncbi:unnamed protein product [Lactuca saligna]|uniref:Spen paralogue and orthologue SPOC C-terminal domain-containing protein n=1 Tax=Lactuca saligna TaxID=75948 RepID=A0AA35Y6N5_LACSI|nr:unnamed protein product [Lactuca saligna]